ncbi:hypothetical protein SAMN05421812_103280 [Asanoa hainanensis]|uniref:Uncharacterized protein n=1 Tax=Asanoa hainanensis TaxID=560556 RepID=A0A239K3D7_9ACTN|nr:hypothetical protein [Asanoa hainanensis]SNT12615.1 hypothetical protein SAMN05421812_103280 [Asanoa hainanensis]
MYRRVTLAAIAAVAAVVGFGAAPAVAAPGPTATTGITFQITAGGLTITAPASVDLGNGVSGGTVAGSIGPVQVVDQRGLLVAAWTATVSSTAYTTGGGTAAETIPNSAATYTPGLPTGTTGVPVPVAGLPGTLASPRTAYTATAVGSNSVTWNPNLSIAIPAAAVVGTYTGTVTHSVA